MTNEDSASATDPASAKRQELHVPLSMSLRDYFAGQALAGMCAASNEPANGLALQRRMADTAYQIADAMIARSAE